MSVPVIAFFNNKGGVGKTTLAYHVAWKLSDLGIDTLACDLDPQANLTAAFLDEAELEDILENDRSTIYRSLKPILEGTGDLRPPQPILKNDHLAILPGDLDLSRYEDELSQNWSKCLDGNERAFRVITGFWRVIQQAAQQCHSQVVLVDLGPSLGAINRAALVASDFIVIPLAPDLFSLRGLKNLGPAVQQWRKEWKARRDNKPPALAIDLPQGGMRPIGYVVLQHGLRMDRVVKAYEKWLNRIPGTYLESVLQNQPTVESPELAKLKHYRSLMPLSHEARKPVFHLKPADGAIGAHYQAVREVDAEFDRLAKLILQRTGLGIETT